MKKNWVIVVRCNESQTKDLVQDGIAHITDDIWQGTLKEATPALGFLPDSTYKITKYTILKCINLKCKGTFGVETQREGAITCPYCGTHIEG